MDYMYILETMIFSQEICLQYAVMQNRALEKIQCQVTRAQSIKIISQIKINISC